MTEFYPGSKRQKRSYEGQNKEMVAKDPVEDLYLGKPKTFLLNGQPVELYPLGALARALNRSTVTVRKWEQEGILPTSPYIMPSHDPRGQRRLYTREQIESLRTVAEEEGLLEPNARGKWKSIEQTQFRDRALQVFRR